MYASVMCIFFQRPTAAGVRVQYSLRALHVCVYGCEPDAWSAEHEKKTKTFAHKNLVSQDRCV